MPPIWSRFSITRHFFPALIAEFAIVALKRPAPINLLQIFIHELQITQDEQKPFLELVSVSRQDYPKITKYITTHPNARTFMQMAALNNIPDEYFKELISKFNEQSKEVQSNHLEK